MERIHIICGMCGAIKDFIFRIGFDEDSQKNKVHLLCNNCSSLTGLDEVIKEDEENGR